MRGTSMRPKSAIGAGVGLGVHPRASCCSCSETLVSRGGVQDSSADEWEKGFHEAAASVATAKTSAGWYRRIVAVV
jgi:hypothetical protein